MHMTHVCACTSACGVQSRFIVASCVCLARMVAWRRIRREEWLAAQVEDPGDREVPVSAGAVKDKYNLDLEVYKMKTGKRPKQWKECCKIASWVHIDASSRGHRFLLTERCFYNCPSLLFLCVSTHPSPPCALPGNYAVVTLSKMHAVTCTCAYLSGEGDEDPA